MNADELLESVRESVTTELSRLGSSKALYAATGGDMETDDVLRAAADAEHAAAETFDAWAADEPNDQARETFEATAEEEYDHFDRVCEDLDDYEPSEEPSALASYLRDLDGTVERAGGLLGRVIVTDESKAQFVGYFVGGADQSAASLFRELREDLDGQEARALDLLDTVCEDDADWETAEDAAIGAVETAYDAYVEQLESLGVDPKPIC